MSLSLLLTMEGNGCNSLRLESLLRCKARGNCFFLLLLVAFLSALLIL